MDETTWVRRPSGPAVRGTIQLAVRGGIKLAIRAAIQEEPT